MAFKILSIDGGGFRGIYAAHILSRIEDEFGDILPCFDLVAGTSTGSIIAAALCCEIKAKEIVRFYTEHGKAIFKPRLHSFLPGIAGIFASQYRSQYLSRVLGETFREKRLGDINKPLIIPATDIGNGTVHVFKSAYDKTFFRDTKIMVKDAVLASCSAPIYFDPIRVDKYTLADGGLWANSPALVAAIDAKKRLGIDFGEIQIMSIGSGTVNEFYSQRPTLFKKILGWGFLTRWGRKKFISTLLHLQSSTANNMLGLILLPEQILRINFNTDDEIPLDDTSHGIDLLSRADKDFTYNAKKIQKFLQK